MSRTKQTGDRIANKAPVSTSGEKEDHDLVPATNKNMWKSLCTKVEESGPVGRFLAKNFLNRLSIEAPVVILFCLICVVLQILNYSLLPGCSKFLGVDSRFNPGSVPMQYIRLVSHIFAHSGLQHLKSNMASMLLVGPSAEHVFGSKTLLVIFFLVAITSAFAHILLGKAHTRQLGASGIVFAMILLNSLVSAKSGKIPVAFVLTAWLWISDEVFKMFFSKDGLSHHAHLAGAIVGTMAGYQIHQQKAKKKLKKIASAWLESTKKD